MTNMSLISPNSGILHGFYPFTRVTIKDFLHTYLLAFTTSHFTDTVLHGLLLLYQGNSSLFLTLADIAYSSPLTLVPIPTHWKINGVVWHISILTTFKHFIMFDQRQIFLKISIEDRCLKNNAWTQTSYTYVWPLDPII